jgi:hypothetical protein
MMAKQLIREQAQLLATENKRSEPDIQKVYWFPDDHEVRLIEVTPSIPASGDGCVHAFHFRPNPGAKLPAPSGVALIRPDEFGNLRLPDRWGDWKDAVELDPGGEVKRRR